MRQKKIAYSAVALSKRKEIKRELRERYGKEVADRISNHISKVIRELKDFPQMGISVRTLYDLECDYYILFVEHNYFVYRIWKDTIVILEIFNEKEDFMYQMFGIESTNRDTIDYWGEE